MPTGAVTNDVPSRRQIVHDTNTLLEHPWSGGRAYAGVIELENLDTGAITNVAVGIGNGIDGSLITVTDGVPVVT